MTILKAANITKSYNTKDGTANKNLVLNNINLDIEQGEDVALIGVSGAGKSTLLTILASIEDADSGDVLLNVDSNFVNYKKLNDKELSIIRNKYIGFIFQFHHLLPEFSAIENVMLPALISGTKNSIAEKDAKYLLEFVGLADRVHHKPSEMSGGEQQRAAIARALINKPLIVFADEPTGNLDTENSHQILNLIKEMKTQFEMTFIMATHSLEVAQSTKKIITIKDGKLSY